MEDQKPKVTLETLKADIKKFADSYNNLSPVAKTQFQRQFEIQIKKEDDRTRALYTALLDATVNGKSIDKTIESMEKADRHTKHGV